MPTLPIKTSSATASRRTFFSVTSRTRDYLDLARQGRNDWWRYVLAIILILSLWQIIGSIPGIFLLAYVLGDGNPHTGVSTSGQFFGVDPNLNFVTFMLASLYFLAGIYLAVRFIHKRPFITLITACCSISWKRIIQGFLVWFFLSGLMALGEALLHPGRYTLTLDIPHYLPFFFMALILIPIQTSAEELFFRGYLLQAFGMRLSNIWMLSILSGLIFMAPHLLNPEARVDYLLMGSYYFLIGAVLAFVTLRDGQLELALGLHAANNLFTALFVNSTITVLPTPSLFTVGTLDPVYSVTAATIGLVLFILIFRKPNIEQQVDAIP